MVKLVFKTSLVFGVWVSFITSDKAFVKASVIASVSGFFATASVITFVTASVTWFSTVVFEIDLGDGLCVLIFKIVVSLVISVVFVVS